jgi:hypothetical protein
MDEAARLAAALESGSRAEREAAYELVGAKIRAGAAGPVSREDAVALAVGFASPLLDFVLSAPASKVELDEWQRASLLLVEMCMSRLDSIVVCGSAIRGDDSGTPRILKPYMSTDNVLAQTLGKDASRWTRDDAITAALSCSFYCCFWEVGATACVDAYAEMNPEDFENSFVGKFLGCPPYLPAEGGDRFVPLCLIALEMLGDPEGQQQQPDSVIAGGWMLLNFIATFNPENSQAFWDAGVLDIMQRTLDGREHRLFCMPFFG